MGFSVTAYGQTRTNLLANPTLPNYFSDFLSTCLFSPNFSKLNYYILLTNFFKYHPCWSSNYTKLLTIKSVYFSFTLYLLYTFFWTMKLRENEGDKILIKSNIFLYNFPSLGIAAEISEFCSKDIFLSKCEEPPSL